MNLNISRIEKSLKRDLGVEEKLAKLEAATRNPVEALRYE
jgi:hypothetical protein